jgi:hypothetical protein
MLSGFDYVFLVLCEIKKFMSRKPLSNLPEAFTMSSPGGESRQYEITKTPRAF